MTPTEAWRGALWSWIFAICNSPFNANVKFWHSMCEVVLPIKNKGFICSSCYYHHQIGSTCIHLSHCYHIFSVVACLRCLLHHGLLLIAYTFQDNREFGNLFSLLLCSLWWVQIIGYVLSRRSYSFICTLHRHCANLSEDIELITCLSDIFCRVYE